MLLSPVDPALEVLYSHFVTVNHLALEVTVDLVEVESVCTRDEALCLEDVCAELVDVAGSSRIVTCRLDTSCEGSCLYFESLYVISLPAVHAEVEVLKLLENFFCVNAEGCVSLFGDFVSLMDKCFFHNCYVVYCLLYLFWISMNLP